MPFYAGRGEKWRVFSNNVLQDLRGLRAAVADAGDALADLAQEFIVDRPLRARESLARQERPVVIVAEDRDHVAGFASGTPETSIMHISMQIRPMTGT